MTTYNCIEIAPPSKPIYIPQVCGGKGEGGWLPWLPRRHGQPCCAIGVGTSPNRTIQHLETLCGRCRTNRFAIARDTAVVTSSPEI